MEIIGNIYKVGTTKPVGNNGLHKRLMVVETQEQYPQKILIEFLGDKCALLDKFKVGDYVSVGINIRGREYTDKQGKPGFFNSIQGWKIQAMAATPVGQPQANDIVTPEEEDDLPF